MLCIICMKEEETISWIFLATALASQTSPTNFNGISMVADGINHAVPTHKELQTSISWLTDHGLVDRYAKKYALTSKGKAEYDKASKDKVGLTQIWKSLEKMITNYA
jgi:hypothetical protein